MYTYNNPPSANSSDDGAAAIVGQLEIGRSSCVLMICPGDRRFTSQKNFEKLLSALFFAEFSNITIVVADGELQAYSAGVKDPDKAFENLKSKCNENGILWEERFRETIRSQLPNANVVHWDDYIAGNLNYTDLVRGTKTAYEDDVKFRAKLNESIKAYLRTIFKNDPSKLESNCLEWKACFEYKIREVAGLHVKAQLGIHFLTYPGNLCPGLDYALNNLIHSKYPNCLHFLKVNLDSAVQKMLIGVNGKYFLEGKKHAASPSLQGNGVVMHTATYPDVFTPAVPQSTVFTELRFMIQNSKNPEEIRFVMQRLLELQQLATTYILAGVSVPGKKVSKEDFSDGGVVFYEDTSPRTYSNSL